MSIVAKVIYSMLLLGLAGVLFRELWTVWFDKTVYIGQFDVISVTGRDDVASATFPMRIVASQAILAQQFNDYQTRRSADAPSDETYVLPGMSPLLLPPEVLAGIDITVQGINLRQVLTSVRRAFLAPSEITGNVAIRDGAVLAAVEWPRAPHAISGQSAMSKFLVPSQSSEQAVAAHIACSISWGRAASLDPSIAIYRRTQFCDFGTALGDLYALSEKASSLSGLDVNDSALVRKRASQLRAHYSAPAVFPDLYRLRADLLDLLPERDRTLEELVEAQEDRIRYAMLSPELGTLSEDEKRLVAHAIARPAILTDDDGKLSALPENWASLMRRHDEEIQAATKSVGIILAEDESPIGTGFVVAPNLMITANFVLTTRGQQGANKLRLCVGSSKSTCTVSLTLGDVIYSDVEGGSHIALVNINGHDPILTPSLLVAEPASVDGTLVGQYAYVIGYPFSGSTMPTGFMERLLGKEEGRKRVMPGRILAFGQPGPYSVGLETPQAAPVEITSDMSTSAGTAGGPLLELGTGRVIGMSYGGIWKGERGKFTYAKAIPKRAFDLIGRRRRGEPDHAIEPKGNDAPTDNDPSAT